MWGRRIACQFRRAGYQPAPLFDHTETRRSLPVNGNPLKLKSIHHVELWVGNAKQAAYFYQRAFGFSEIAYAGLESGQRDHTSYALSQGKARIVLTSPLQSGG